MATLLAANNAISTVAAPILATATTVLLATGTGELFPNPQPNQYFVATRADAATGLILEIVWVTARSADTLTIVRGQENTTPVAWGTGDSFANLWTAGQATGPAVRAGFPLNYHVFAPGLPNIVLSQVLFGIIVGVGEGASIPANLGGAITKALAAATYTYVLTVSHNGTSVGTITWAATATVPTVSVSAFTIAPGDIILGTGQATPDPTLAGIMVGIYGTLTS